MDDFSPATARLVGLTPGGGGGVARASIHTSRGFGGYRPPSGYDALSSLRFLGPTIQIAAPLTCLWLTAFSMNILLLVQSILTVKQPNVKLKIVDGFQLERDISAALGDRDDADNSDVGHGAGDHADRLRARPRLTRGHGAGRRHRLHRLRHRRQHDRSAFHLLRENHPRPLTLRPLPVGRLRRLHLRQLELHLGLNHPPIA
ncbi:unnamed protein product [Bemisia tabaci]|uniref:Uncharacterized protein n=1 Tax=Bemisia tabaci TaxID=7038 RepID=A0A9P0AF34_BEMTA|nr:unnamed protein product [Bemisia tabaci]